MENLNEANTSQKVELDVINEDDTIDTIREKFNNNSDKFKNMSDGNKQLYSRAKKAEGFEFKDGEWVKKEITKPKEKSTEVKTDKKGLSYGQKALLRAEGIKRGKETELVEEIREESGKDLESVLDSKYFQASLKELREETKVKEATPSSSKRGTSSSKGKVEYWLNKEELPPVDEVELRREVVNTKLKQEKDKSNFTSNPVGNITVK